MIQGVRRRWLVLLRYLILSYLSIYHRHGPELFLRLGA
jgi:hypothetical protein